MDEREKSPSLSLSLLGLRSTLQPSKSESNFVSKEEPQKSGNFRTLRAGWEEASVHSSPRSPYSPSITDIPLTISTSNKSLKDAFLSDTHSRNVFPPVSPIGGNPPSHRYAGIERLSQRHRIYDLPIPSISTSFSSVTAKEGVFLNAKRDMFFSRESPQNSNNSIESSLNSNSTPTSISNAGPKDYYFTRRESRDREDMNSGRDKPLLAKDSDINVGFYDLPNQIHRKTERKGFEFTLMVVGESGLGKSTLVNSMFFTNIYSDEYPGPSKRATKTVKVETTKVRLKEKNVNLLLTIVDTPGFGCAVDNSNCWQPITDYIENRYEDYLNAETRLHRSSIQDNRVHCCLYFIYPSGHSLKPIDIEFMQHLHDKVNIIPVIAKADTLTPEECLQFKKNVMNEISQHQIKIYEFPESDSDEDNKLLKQLKSRIPFAVVGSNFVIENGGERKRGRKYPWGVVEVENLEHCDFIAIRSMLLKYYMFDLLDTTNNIHYENYRCRKLSGIGNERVGKPNRDSNKNPLAQMEEEKKEHEAKMKKMEQEMEQVFEMKVKEKMQKLKDSEADLQRRHEQMNATLQQKRQELEDKRQNFEKEKAAFELVSRDMEEIRKASTLEANSKENLEKKKEKKKGLF